MMLSSRNRSPFTETQWQELEHQALIFKYMISGIPIPPDLIYTVKKSLMDSSPSANLYSHQPGGWGCFQVGFGRRADPEPGRCRRTDGKKWRCSKEAYPESKYCERHMHRGKNRSRKPVEVITTPNTSNTTSTTSSSYSLLSLSSSSLASDQTVHPPHIHPYHNNTTTTTPLYPFPYPLSSSSSSSRPPTSSVLSSQNNTSHEMLLDSGSYSQADKDDYRYFNGMRESLDERAFFPEASGSLRSLPESYTPLTISSSSGYSSQFQSLGDDFPKQQQQHKEQHCFVLGTDFKSTRPIKSERDQYTDDEAQKQMHHFFSEKWPQKDRDSWLDLEDDPSTHSSFSTTQLSMSLPMSSHHDLFAHNSRLHNDG